MYITGILYNFCYLGWIKSFFKSYPQQFEIPCNNNLNVGELMRPYNFPIKVFLAKSHEN
jgi:hypothetical protein